MMRYKVLLPVVMIGLAGAAFAAQVNRPVQIESVARPGSMGNRGGLAASVFSTATITKITDTKNADRLREALRGVDQRAVTINRGSGKGGLAASVFSSATVTKATDTASVARLNQALAGMDRRNIKVQLKEMR